MPYPRISLTASLTIASARADPAASSSPIEIFTSPSQSLWLPRGARGVFGGQVIAQALLSATRTISHTLSLHSQHCYFLVAADAASPIVYTVERLRDGKSYATRLVRAIQMGKMIFVQLASFTSDANHLSTREVMGRPSVSGDLTKSRDGQVSGVSLSSIVAVEPNPAATMSRRREDSTTAEQAFVSRWQIAMPIDVMGFVECELEQDRWQRFADESATGKKLSETARKAVEEYIQVSQLDSPFTMVLDRTRRRRGRILQFRWR